MQHQSTNRHSEAWKDSLRYRRPDLDRMAGIRRITLNANPLISDDGVLAFAEALRDDLWLKGINTQALDYFFKACAKLEVSLQRDNQAPPSKGKKLKEKCKRFC